MARSTALVSPFRVTLDVNLELGRNRESKAIDALLTPLRGDTVLTRRDLVARLASRRPGLFDRVVEKREELALTGEQQSQLATLGGLYESFRDSTYFELAGVLLNRQTDVRGPSQEQRWHSAVASVIWRQWEIAQQAKQLLSAPQVGRVFAPENALVPQFAVLERGELERQLKRWLPSSY